MINMVNQSLFSYKPYINYASFSKVIVLKIKISTDYKIVLSWLSHPNIQTVPVPKNPDCSDFRASPERTFEGTELIHTAATCCSHLLLKFNSFR